MRCGHAARDAAGIGAASGRSGASQSGRHTPLSEWVLRLASTDDLTLYGEERAKTIADEIAVGRMSMLFVGGLLDDLAIDGEVLLRAVQFIHRDRYWRRIEPTLEAFESASGPDRYRATWTLRYAGDECDLSVAHVVEVTNSEIAVTAEATAHSPTVTNRTGFILLHPARETVGRSVDVTHPDGTVTREIFPETLSQHAVLSGIAALAFSGGEGTELTIALSGDVFETEDQRNWTDGSFKTFSRPLSEPVPYRIEPGAPVSQAVCITAGPRLPAAAHHVTDTDRRPVSLDRSTSLAAAFLTPDGEAPVVHATLGSKGTGRRMPRLGFGVHFERASADEETVDALRRLRPSVLQFRLNPGDPVEGVAAFANLAKRTGADAALELISGYRTGDRSLSKAIEAMAETGLAPSALTLYPETDADLAAARTAFPGSRIGGGTPLFFVLAHRAQLPNGLDFVQWTMPPGVHDISDRAIMETLACVPDVLDRARQLWADKALWIGPTALRPRFRPATLNKDVAPLDPGGRPDDIDPRQQGLFVASWTVGYLARLAYGGADTALMLEPFGARGVMDRVSPGSATGIWTFPIYDVLLALANAQGCDLIPVGIDREDLVLGLAWQGKAAAAVFANLSPRPVRLRVSGVDLNVRSVTGRQSEASGDAIVLSAFEVVAFGDAAAS
jgi:hypothetical protein